MQNAAGAGRRAFGPRWFAKLGLISFAAGGLLEFAMIKSGFYEAVVATSSAPDWQNSWQEVGAEVQRQLREKRERGDIPEPTRVERVLQQLEARYQQQLNQDQPPSAPSSSSTSTSTQEQKESETIK